MPFPLTTHTQPDPYTSPWPAGERLRILLWSYVWPVLCRWTPKPLNRWRLLWLRLFGARIQGSPFVHGRARITAPWRLTLHDRACLGDGAHAYALGPIELCEDSTIAQEAYLCTGTHDLSHRIRPLQTAPIVIGKGAFVGLRAIILPGVQVGERAVVGAGSVVTRDVPPGECWAGNPAHPLPRREPRISVP